MLYLDHAATSFPKPPEVLAAVMHWYQEVGVSATRGDGARCTQALAQSQQARAGIAKLCGVRSDRVAFTSGATESANLFLRGFLRAGDVVVATAAEHSAVARPLRALERERGVRLHVVATDDSGYVDPAAVEHAVRQHGARLLALNHGSNVTGAVQDARALVMRARALGCRTLLDASQTIGVLEVAVAADACIASAHKSLLGPPGLGILAVADDVDLVPAKQGGTGSSAALDVQPAAWPTGFEAGTPNGPAIAGLGAALTLHAARAPGAMLHHQLAFVDALHAALRARLGASVRLLGDPARPRIGVLSFTLRDLDPAEAGAVLDAQGIHVRTGFHCAPWIHGCLGTQRAGTIRVSPGPNVSADAVPAVVRALAP
jgi:selenocysteine lyase/cysteine desulfurase